LRPREELVGPATTTTALTGVGLRASQVVYQLAATTRALVTLQQLFLYHVLRLRVASHARIVLWLAATDDASAVAQVLHVLAVLIHASSV